MKRIQSLAWSPDGRWLASSDDEGSVVVRNVDRSVVAWALDGLATEVRSLSWGPDSRRLACGLGHWESRSAGLVQVCDTGGGAEVWTSSETTRGCYAVSFDPGGRWLASGHGSGAVYLWDADTGEKHLAIAVEENITNLVNGVGFSPDGDLVAFGTCYEDRLYVHDTGGQLQAELTYGKRNTWVDFEHPVRFSPDGRWLARGTQDGPVRLWLTATFSSPVSLTGHDMPSYAIAWHPSGRFLAGGSRDGTIRIWNVGSLAEVGSITHGRPLHTICYSPDGRLLASGGDDAAIHVWDAAPGSKTLGQKVRTFR